MCAAELRTRRDVWNLTHPDDWPAALRSYETAVQAMRERDPGPGLPADRLGWRYLAAMHGVADRNGDPITSDPLWNNCQHGSWLEAWTSTRRLALRTDPRQVFTTIRLPSSSTPTIELPDFASAGGEI